MTAGKATGTAREYQVLCRDVLQRRFGGTPYAGDGIDVPFAIAGTTFNLDVALRGSGVHAGHIILAECRNTVDAQKQKEVAAFAFQAERIRRVTGMPVAAFFMVASEPQIGAVKLEADVELSVAVVTGTDLSDARVAFLGYDTQREEKLRNHLIFLERATYQIQTGTVEFVVHRADGSVEKH